MFGGQVGVAGHITVGNHVTTGAQAGIAGSVKPGNTIQGSPAIEAKNFARSSIVFKKLPEMYATLNSLQKEIEELKKQINNK